MPIEVYVAAAVLLAIAGVAARIVWLKHRAKSLKKDLEITKVEAEIVKAEVVQVRRTEKSKAEVALQLRAQQVKDQARIDADEPRDHFDTTEF